MMPRAASTVAVSGTVTDEAATGTPAEGFAAGAVEPGPLTTTDDRPPVADVPPPAPDAPEPDVPFVPPDDVPPPEEAPPLEPALEDPSFVRSPDQLLATPSQPDGIVSPRVASNPAQGSGAPVWSS
jgi:hypothetical protein